MKNFLQTIWRQVKDFWNRLTQSQKIRLGVLTVLLVAIIVVATVILGRVDYTVLYSNMSDAEAAEVYTLLEGMSVDVRSAQTGEGKTSLSVPAGQVEDLRMQMAAQGYPKQGSSTSIYQQGAGLTSTTQTQETMRNYQDAENLRRSIVSMDDVIDAVVLLNIKPTSAFVIDRTSGRSSASVLLTLTQGVSLSDEGVRAIAHLVSSASRDMLPEDVVITDTTGKLYRYTPPDEAAEPFVDPTDKYAQERAFERSLEDRLLDYFYPIFGDGLIAQAKATMNFDKKTIEETVYAPPVPEAGNAGLPVSYRELYETITGETEAAAGATGLDENGGAPTMPYEGDAAGGEPYSRIEREVNNNLNEVHSLIEKAPGAIEDLTVSLLYSVPEGFPEDAAIDEKLIQNAVMNATGIADKVKVTVGQIPMVNIPAAGDPAAAARGGLSGSDLAQLIRMGIIFLALIIVAALLAKLLRDITKPKEAATEAAVQAGEPLYDLMVGEPEEAMVIPEFEIGTKNINRERIEQLIEKDPESVAQLLRSWLTEE